MIEFRTHKGKVRDPYFHQGNDFSAWGHEGILHCPSKFPTKDNTMLEADEIIVLDVVRNDNPKKNYLTLAMVNHKKGVIFSTYHHTYAIFVKEKDKIKPGDVLGNYWKYIKTSDNNEIIGYANSTGTKKNHLRGAASQGAFPIYHFPNKGNFPYFVKTSANLYHMLDIGKSETVRGEDFANRALKFKNEHFHVERRFVDKKTYTTKYLNKEETFLSFNNINLSQNFTTHFNNHTNIKKVALNSSFGDLIPASALLDTGSAESKFLLKELENLRDADRYALDLKQAYSRGLDVTKMNKLILAAKDSMIRDYTMLLMFEKIVKLACEFQDYMKGKDNCNLSQLKRQIIDAKQILIDKKLKK